MKLTINATPEEILEKGDKLVEAFVREVAPYHPDLAERLAKALPESEPVKLKDPVLEHIAEQTSIAYGRMLHAMNSDILKILERKPPIIQKAVERDPADLGFQRIKSTLLRKGYVEADFETGGALASYTTPQLFEMVKGLNAGIEPDVVREQIQKAEPAQVDPLAGVHSRIDAVVDRLDRTKAPDLPSLLHQVSQLQKAEPPVVHVTVPPTKEQPAPVVVVPEALTKAVEHLATIAANMTRPETPQPPRASTPAEVTFVRDESGRVIGASLKPKE